METRVEMKTNQATENQVGELTRCVKPSAEEENQGRKKADENKSRKRKMRSIASIPAAGQPSLERHCRSN